MDDFEVAVAAVEAGADIVRERFGSALARLDKGGGDFATDVDVAAEDAMLAVLRRERAGDAILGEERGRTGSSEATRVWLIDPLCGTLNYAAGMRVVAVNAALRVDGRLTAAAVADPFNREIFWTDGVSASRRTGLADERLRPSAVTGLVDLNLDPPFPSAPGFKVATLLTNASFGASLRPRVVSSSLALAWVATGQRAAYVTDGDVRESVHFAAGVALCAAAGCAISDLRGEPCGERATGLIAASDAAVHAALLQMIRNA